MSIPKFLFCFYLTFTVLLVAFSFGNVLYCQNCPNPDVVASYRDWEVSSCMRCTSVDQFHKEIFKLMPDIRTVARVFHLGALEHFAALFNMGHPATIEIISLMTMFLLASIVLSSM